MTGQGTVIIGTGQAGYQAAVSLRQAGYEHPVRMIGDEPGLPYQRPPLSKGFLESGFDCTQLEFRPKSFYEAQKIELIAPDAVVHIDRPEKRVTLGSETRIGYDHLILATGARNRPLPVEGAALNGVMALRTRADALRLSDALSSSKKVVLIGAGFIGLEIAAAAVKRGCATTVIEAVDRPMARVLSPEMSAFFRSGHQSRGTRFCFNCTVARLLGEGGRVNEVELGDGQKLPADLVVIGIGVIPNHELAAAAGLPVDDGVLVNERLATADPAIFAIGDCARHPNPFAHDLVRLESVQNAVDQARLVAAQIAGRPCAPYDAVPWFWTDQFDLKLKIVGITTGYDQAVLRGQPDEGGFSIFCFQDDRLLGAETLNRQTDYVIVRRLMANGGKISPAEAGDLSVDLKALAGR